MKLNHSADWERNGILVRTQVPVTEADPIGALKAQLSDHVFSLITLFVSPEADFAEITRRAQVHFSDTDVVACTTAGELGEGGYEEGMIIFVGYPAAHFASVSLLIDDLAEERAGSPILDDIAHRRVALQDRHPGKPQGFGFLVVDGLSLKEDALTASISLALSDMPLFGGSAGDGTSFEKTLVSLNGEVSENAAILTLIQTDYITQVFSIDHLLPTDGRMVVTDADPDRRIVKRINAAPAAREYARIVGKDPDQLDKFTFASHPVVVRIGNTHHVRAIQQVNEHGELVFFSAIDVGMVLSIAEPQVMSEHLDAQLSKLSSQAENVAILGCDCILRRLEAQEIQVAHQISDVLKKHKVYGFSTYGEQFGSLHVNHTMTGVAIFPQPAVRR